MDLDKTSGLCAGVPPIIGPKFSQIGETARVLSPKNAKSHRPPANYGKTLERSRLQSTPPHSACSESVGGPSGAARGRQPHFRRAHDGGRKSLRRRRRSAGGRSDRSTTSPRPQNAAPRHVSTSTARSSAFRAVSRIIVTTSGEPILLPVRGRHTMLNLGRRPLARYSDFDIPPSSSRTYPAYRTFQVQNGG